MGEWEWAREREDDEREYKERSEAAISLLQERVARLSDFAREVASQGCGLYKNYMCGICLSCKAEEALADIRPRGEEE
jgi:hypothetical protein